MSQITQIIGNLTKDAEMKVTNSGKELCELNVATDRMSNGEGKKFTEYWKIAVSGKCAEMCSKLVKGQKIRAMGEGHCDLYTTKDGKCGINRSMWVNNVEFLSPKNFNAATDVPDTAGFADVSSDEIPF